MNIYYSSSSTFDLTTFGIAIPLTASRVDEILKHCSAYAHFIKESPISYDDLLLVHTESFVKRIQAYDPTLILECYELASVEGVDTRSLVDRVLDQTGVVVNLFEQIVQNSETAFYLGGGMHHAMSDRPSGFCLVNDIAVAIKKARRRDRDSRFLIVDVDAHKGDGSAEIFYKDVYVDTLSIHMKQGWPLSTHNSQSHIPSTFEATVDVDEESDYLPRLKQLFSTINLANYQGVIVVLGSDPSIHDELPGTALLKLSDLQMLERDKFIYDQLTAYKLPTLYLLGGGYGNKAHRPYLEFFKYSCSR